MKISLSQSSPTTSPQRAPAQDFRYAFRGLGKSPGFSAVAVLTLTLGIGASMAILTVVNSVLLRSLPFRDADRLVVLFATSPARRVYRDTTSFPDFLDWKGQSQSFTAVAAWQRDPFNVTGGGAPEPIVGLRASHELFQVLSVSPALGRGFDKEEQEGKSPVAAISHGLWMSSFGGEPDVLGKSIVLNDVRHRGRDLEPVPQVFVPYQQDPYRSLPYTQQPYVSLVVRTAADPAKLIKAVQARIWAVDKDQPISNIQTMEHALSQSIANRRIYLLLLSVFAAIALLVATAGIYGLVSYTVACRTQEMGIRVALGATVGQILALVIRQGILLTLIGVVIGIGGSLVLTKAISGLLYGITPTDAPTFIGTALVFIAVAFVATYIPARRATTIDPTVALRFE